MGYRNPDEHVNLTYLAEQGSGFCEDFYPVSAEGDESPLLDNGYDVYYGRNVLWLGSEGEMFKAEPRYIEPIDGNIFDEDKLAAVVDCVTNAPGRVPFVAPIADVHVITPTDIKESFEYQPDDPWTTGDDELDEWIKDPEEFIDENLDCEDYDSPEEWREAIDELTKDMNGQVAEAVRQREGDLGSFRVQIRDGNHRAFGALAAGEPYVYVWLIDWVIQDIKEALRPELAEEIE